MWWWIILVAILFYIGISLRKSGNYWKNRGVRQVDPWPLVGNFAGNFLGRISMPDQIQYLYNYYPKSKYVGLYQLGSPVLLLRDPELVKVVAVKDFDSFIDHKIIFTEDIDPLFGKNLVSLKGQAWRDMRSILSPAFTSSKMRTMYILIKQCAEQFADYFSKEASKQNNILNVEMKDIFTRYTNDVIATCAFGITCDSLKEKNNEFYVIGKKCTTFGYLATLKFFGYLICTPLMKFFQIKLFGKDVENFFRNIIKTTIEVREREGTVRPDMIHLLMEARKGKLMHDLASADGDAGFATVRESNIGKAENPNKLLLTDEDITAQALLFFLAGYDTSSTVMSFLAHELAVNPDVQKKLQDEVDRTLKKCNGNIDYEALLQMKYLDMVISEILRKWPAAPLTERLCHKPYDLKVDDETIHIEKDMSVWMPVFCFHRNPEYFPDPERFDPERFSDENKNNIIPFSYIPFGTGPRNCIGSRFALLEVKALYVHLLSKFNIVVIEKTQIPLQISKKSFNMIPNNGFWLGLEPRK